MNLSLAEVFTDPYLVTYTIDLPTSGKTFFRPLKAEDVDRVATFLEGLSAETRRFKFFPSFDQAGATILCEKLSRSDLLLFVLELIPSQEIIGFFELSFAISEDDLSRFDEYGLYLDAATDCRIGLALADEYQNKGVGSMIFPTIIDIATRLGKKRIVLWGGVFSDNPRAIRLYEKQGFRSVGTFADYYGRQSLDMMLELAI